MDGYKSNNLQTHPTNLIILNPIARGSLSVYYYYYDALANVATSIPFLCSSGGPSPGEAFHAGDQGEDSRIIKGSAEWPRSVRVNKCGSILLWSGVKFVGETPDSICRRHPTSPPLFVWVFCGMNVAFGALSLCSLVWLCPLRVIRLFWNILCFRGFIGVGGFCGLFSVARCSLLTWLLTLLTHLQPTAPHPILDCWGYLPPGRREGG